jgi:uncharacterized protein YdaU (DUF1376 family)
MHYYKFNIADYRKDTGHLSTIEHGIYRQLIDWYYLDEQPIPEETQVVLRRLRLGSDDVKFLQNVLSDFFVLGKAGYTHKRIEVEIKDYSEQVEKNKNNGRLGGRPKKTQSVISGLPDESQNNPNHKPLTINQEPNISICPPSGELDDPKIPKCEHQAVIDMYHKYLPTLRKVEVWNSARQGYLRQRWREVAIELSKDKDITAEDILTWFGDFFQHIGMSKFLTGKVNSKDGRAFTADLEWILKPSNFAKIVEGKYHGTN